MPDLVLNEIDSLISDFEIEDRYKLDKVLHMVARKIIEFDKSGLKWLHYVFPYEYNIQLNTDESIQKLKFFTVIIEK